LIWVDDIELTAFLIGLQTGSLTGGGIIVVPDDSILVINPAGVMTIASEVSKPILCSE